MLKDSRTVVRILSKQKGASGKSLRLNGLNY